MTTPPDAALRTLLVETSVADLARSTHGVVTLSPDASVEAALRTLASHKILSAPVVDGVSGIREGERGGGGGGNACRNGATTRHHCASRKKKTPHPTHTQEGEILGFLDVRDVIMSLLESLPAEVGEWRGWGVGGEENGTTRPVVPPPPPPNPQTVTSKLLLKRMKDLETAGPKFAATRVADLPVFGGDGSFVPAGAARRVSVLELVNDGFLHPRDTHAPKGGDGTPPVVHRAAVTGGDGGPTAVVSQSDVARFLSTHESSLGALGGRTVAEAGWTGRGAVIAVTPETSALAALALMREQGISGVAVVDAHGRLVGNFSVSDLRSVVPEHFGSLALPVAEFLALEHG